MDLAQAPRHAPFRLHCVRALHAVAAHAEVYVPSTKCLLLTLQETVAPNKGGEPPQKRPKAGKTKAVAVDFDAFAHHLDLGDDRDAHCRTELGKEVVEVLLDYLEIVKHSAAAPELALVPNAALKHLAKEKKCTPKLRAAATAAANAFEAAAKDASKKRAQISDAPKDVTAFEPLLPKGAKPAKDRLADRARARDARRKRLLGLANADAQKPTKKTKAQARADAPPKPTKKQKPNKSAAPKPDAFADSRDDMVGDLDPDDF